MLDLTQRLIAIPSENPPGNQYEECARTLFDELRRLGFDDVRREGACVLASVGTGPRTLYFSGHYDSLKISGKCWERRKCGSESYSV
jgi:acetylornithine deacetylase/succinyl-diaminopimelate desuccinylase-like protein